MRRFFETSLLTTTLIIGLGAVAWAATNQMDVYSAHILPCFS